MERGVSIGNCTFRYLAYSNSQIKNHSFWMLCEDAIRRQDIIRTLGKFSDEDKPLKKGSRIGQNFSSTKQVKRLRQRDDPVDKVEAVDDNGEPLNTVFHIEDIPSAHAKIPFTDGAGNISSDLASLINQSFRLRFCVAYQIRLAGYKGVLLLKKQGMRGQVEVRPSMRKFKGSEYALGIIRCATSSVAYLNRQVIMLLSSLKVPSEIFMSKLDEAIKLLDRRVTHRNLMRQIKAAMDHPSTEVRDLHKEFELHFGPSQQFKTIFVKALIYEATVVQTAIDIH